MLPTQMTDMLLWLAVIDSGLQCRVPGLAVGNDGVADSELARSQVQGMTQLG